MEFLSRGVVAVNQGGGKIFVGWRLLGTDAENTAFNLYRETSGKVVKLNDKPLAGATNFVDETAELNVSNSYFVRVVAGKKEQPASAKFTLPANAPVRQYLSVPLKTPAGYAPNDASVGDLDGDGEYEIVLHQVGRGRDNSFPGLTTEPVLQAYRLDGTLLWTINLGKNIREGAHYTQFIVYDLDGDGRAEIACKTADGTVDGKGKVIGDAAADWRAPEGTVVEFKASGGVRRMNVGGKILSGPEYLTVFDGLTGGEIVTTKFVPPRHPSKLNPTADELSAIWGDGSGNRGDRFLAAVAYLDGEHPSLIMSRGYYTRTVIAAWDFRKSEIKQRWVFDSDSGDAENRKFAGQGNHNLSVGDVDGDGKDEIVFGAMVVDDDGKGLYSTGLGHGDAMHLSDLDPARPGLEVFDIQERFDDAGAHFRDARTGEILWKKPSLKAEEDGEGPGRGAAFDIDPRYKGFESWVRGAGIEGVFNAKGEKISERVPNSCNFGVYWDGDALRELLDWNRISKWNWTKQTTETLLVAEGALSTNGTKATPALSADILGDWREEVILRSADNQELRIYTTTIPTERRLYTLMHDPQYRLSIAWQNVGYNQPPHLSFFLGEELKTPPRPLIKIVQPRKR